MSKAKKLLREHDAAVVQLTKKLMEAYEIYKNSSISTVEFVGNLEATKYIALSEADKAKVEFVDELDELLESIFGDKDEED